MDCSVATASTKRLHNNHSNNHHNNYNNKIVCIVVAEPNKLKNIHTYIWIHIDWKRWSNEHIFHHFRRKLYFTHTFVYIYMCVCVYNKYFGKRCDTTYHIIPKKSNFLIVIIIAYSIYIPWTNAISTFERTLHSSSSSR